MGFEIEVGELTEIERRYNRISLEWTLPDFLSLDTKNYECYESPPFTFCDALWNFRICPQLPYEGLLLICSEREYLVPTTTFDAMLGVRWADGVENKEEGTMTPNWDNAFCWNGFCPRLELAEWKSRLILEKDLIISLDLQSGPERGHNEVQECFRKLLAGGEYSDVTIKIKDKEFPVHRLVLKTRSPVFKTIFNDMVEEQCTVVTLDETDPESFPAFLDHVYTDSLEIISVENVFSLFTTADYFEMRTLKKSCREFIKNNLTVSCFCDAITLAKKHNDKELMQCVTEFFSSDKSEIVKTVEWQIFLRENNNVGNELLNILGN